MFNMSNNQLDIIGKFTVYIMKIRLVICWQNQDQQYKSIMPTSVTYVPASLPTYAHSK